MFMYRIKHNKWMTSFFIFLFRLISLKYSNTRIMSRNRIKLSLSELVDFYKVKIVKKDSYCVNISLSAH